MTHAVLASIIYAPLRPLLRLWRIVIYFLANLDHILETDFDRYAYSEAGRRELEAGIAFGEDGINIAAQALGTEGEIGYVVTDVAQRPDQRALDQLASIEGTIRMRVIS